MEQRRLLRDSLFNLSASVLTAGLGLLAVPLFVSHLPTAAYADWIITLATAKTAVVVDFGVGWTMVHVIAAQVGPLSAATQAQLRAAATFLAGLAVIAAIGTFAVGAVQFGDLHGHRLAILFAGAIMAAMSHFNSYSMAVLWGLRRFDLSGLIVSAEAVAQSGGVILILICGGDIMTIAAWEATVVSTAAMVKFIVARRLCPEAAFRPLWQWPKAPAGLVRFSLGSQICDGFSSVFWTLGVLVVGQVAGPAAVVVFHVAQKVPLALAGFITRAAEVTMPAASSLASLGADAHATIAVSSARIAVAISVPAIVTMWIIADPFMRLWVGNDADALVMVMRMAAIAVAAHSIGESARYYLWGSGRVGTILVVQAIGAAVVVIGAGLLAALARFDTISFSALQAVALVVMSTAFSALTAGRAGLTGSAYATRVTRGVVPATAAAVAVGAILAALWPTVSWLCMTVTATGVTGTFLALMIGFGLDPEESAALRGLLRIS